MQPLLATARNLLLLSASMALSACQQGIEAAGRKVDAPGVPVALVGVEGAPAALQAEVDNQVVTQASARRIELVSGAEQPRYRLRGYLTAYPTENGETALAFVWDVFDSAKQRAQRVSTTTLAKGSGADPWAQIGESQIEKATSQSMNQVAAFLAGSSTASGASGVSAAAGVVADERRPARGAGDLEGSSLQGPTRAQPSLTFRT